MVIKVRRAVTFAKGAAAGKGIRERVGCWKGPQILIR